MVKETGVSPIKLVITAAVLAFLFVPSIALSEMKIFEKEYVFQASEADSKLSSRSIALEQVKRLLLEELGVYLEAKTEVKSLQVTKDQIVTLTGGIVEMQVVKERWDGRTYYVKARITTDTAELARAMERLRRDNTKTRALEEARRKAEELSAQREKLKSELMVVKGEVRSGKIDAHQKDIKELTAVQWFEKGYEYQGTGNYNAAIDAYNKAITLNPQFTNAYKNRGSAYNATGDYYRAIKEFDRAIELDPDSAETYYNRGTACDNLGNYPQAVRDFNKAIELNPNLVFAYFNRAIAYHNLKNFKQAVSDYKTAARMGHKQAQDFLRSNNIGW